MEYFLVVAHMLVARGDLVCCGGGGVWKRPRGDWEETPTPLLNLTRSQNSERSWQQATVPSTARVKQASTTTAPPFLKKKQKKTPAWLLFTSPVLHQAAHPLGDCPHGWMSWLLYMTDSFIYLFFYYFIIHGRCLRVCVCAMLVCMRCYVQREFNYQICCLVQEDRSV